MWIDPLLPGKHPINTRVMKVELVPTTNIVLNWAQRTEAHQYDQRLSSILVRSKDGFSFSLDVAQIIHIGMKNAPRVISRVGSMQNLVDHVLQPTVGNYFRNSAQEVTVLEFLSARSERQREAFDNIQKAIEAYDVECIDTLIGDIVPPAELMKTQTDRKIAGGAGAHLRRAARGAGEASGARARDGGGEPAERGRAVRADGARSRSRTRSAAAESARGEANATRLRAEGQAAAVRLERRARSGGDPRGRRREGRSVQAGHRGGRRGGYTAMQLASILGENKVKLVPDIARQRRRRQRTRDRDDRPHAVPEWRGQDDQLSGPRRRAGSSGGSGHRESGRDERSTPPTPPTPRRRTPGSGNIDRTFEV